VTAEIVRRHDLTTAQYDLLALLHESGPTESSVSAIGTRMWLRTNTVTELITRAEDAGLVARTRDRGDRRVVVVAPTREGTRRYYAAVVELRPERTRLLGFLREAADHAAALAPAEKTT
jgi:DNA-binding MarR family transcriptional regulator